MLHRYEEAVKDCEQAVAQDPSLLKAYTRGGRAYLHMGVLDKAARCFEEVRTRAHALVRAKFDGPAPPTSSRAQAGEFGRWWWPCFSSTSLLTDPPPTLPSVSTERRALEEAIQEAADGRMEVQKVEAALRDAEAHSKRVEWGQALERAEGALRYAHRAKAAMRIKVKWRWCFLCVICCDMFL